jgi:hypothetical protein
MTNAFNSKEPNSKTYYIINNRSDLSSQQISKIGETIQGIQNKTSIEKGLDFIVIDPEEILQRIYKLTQGDFDYCIENNILQLSPKHIEKGYLETSPNILIKRGWPDKKRELIKVFIEVLINISSIEKGKIRFHNDGKDGLLTYTIRGKLPGEDQYRRLAIGFQKNTENVYDSIVAITPLDPI